MEDNACYPCIACCIYLNIKGRKAAGCLCPHLDVGKCGIYDHRPWKECEAFKCAWLAKTLPLPPDFRPDQSGLILMPDSNRIMLIGRSCEDVALATANFEMATPWIFQAGYKVTRLLTGSWCQDAWEDGLRYWFLYDGPALRVKVVAPVPRSDEESRKLLAMVDERLKALKIDSHGE